jgi:cellobiose phosphorylase
LESILGIRVQGDAIYVDPCISPGWSGFEVTLKLGDTTWEIHVANPDGVERGVALLTVDDREVEGGRIERVADGGTHLVLVRMGHRPE